jgi:4-amino-4-deoxy-L-arabinose transferase-like glycosyltransferase
MTDRLARSPGQGAFTNDRTASVRASRVGAWIRHHPVIATSILMLGTALALRAFSFTSAGLDWDESLYIVIAQRWLHGEVPYLAIWDQHPMGLPALFAAAQWAIGDGLLAARLAAFLAVVGTAILLARFLASFADETPAGILAGLLYLFYMSRPEGLAANTEVFNNLIVTAASLLLLGEMARPATTVRGGVVFAAALLFGLGLQIKYVVLPEAVLLCGALLIRLLRDGAGLGRTLGLAVLAAVGGLLPTIAATLYFWHEGALEPYLDANLRANMVYLGDPLSWQLALLRLRFGLLPIVGLLPWPFVLAWLWRDGAVRRRFGLLGLWLSLWLVAAALDVVWPMKFWKHYFNALVPPLCLMAGLAAVLLAERARSWQRSLLASLIVVTVLPAIGSMVKHAPDSRTIGRVNVPLALAEHIRQGGTNGQDVYVFNYDALVYAYADAAPPTRYVLGIALAEFSKYVGERAAGEIDRILAGQPRWLIVAEPSPYEYPASVWQRLTATLQRYRLAAEYPESDYIQPPITVRLYELRTDG